MSTCLKRINISRTRPFCSWGNAFCLWGCDILCVADPPSLKLPPGSWYVRKIKRIAHDRFIKTPKPLKQLHSKCIDCETQSENHLLYSPFPWATYCIDVRVRAIDIPSVNQKPNRIAFSKGIFGYTRILWYCNCNCLQVLPHVLFQNFAFINICSERY